MSHGREGTAPEATLAAKDMIRYLDLNTAGMNR